MLPGNLVVDAKVDRLTLTEPPTMNPTEERWAAARFSSVEEPVSVGTPATLAGLLFAGLMGVRAAIG